MKTQVTIRSLSTALATIILLSGLVQGQQVRQLFVDDFSDGEAQDGSPIPWWWDAAKGDVAVVDGDLWMRPKVRLPDLLALAPRDIYSDDMQKYVGDLVVTVQFTTTQSGGSSAGVFVRCSSRSALDVKGYVGGIGTNNQLFLIRFDGSPSSMKQLGWRMLPNVDIGSEDIIFQLSISDFLTIQGTRSSRIELRAWQPGEEMPTQPQVSATDSQYSEGYAGFYADSGDSAPGIADATVRWIEFVGECLEPVVDFNGDRNVEINDLLRLIESWGQADPTCDIAPPPSGNGMVDVQDLELFMSYWGQPVDDSTLIAHWALDETEGVIACDSAGGNDAYVLGDAVWQPTGGQVNGAIELDGIDDVVIAESPLNPADGPFSVFAWIRGGATGQVLISQVDGENWLLAGPVDGCLMTEIQNDGHSNAALCSQTVVTDGDWHRAGLTWDGAMRSLYVDNVLVAEDAPSGMAGCHRGLNLGCGTSMVPGTFFAGLVDDVRIYTRAVKP